ncbi:MAG: flagellar basal body P-ring protein FlgI [Pirellulaceae bacterium]
MAILIDNSCGMIKNVPNKKRWLIATVLIGLIACCFPRCVAGQPPRTQQLETLPAPAAFDPAPVLPAPVAKPMPPATAFPATGVRIKDITRLQGYRTNKLTGMGLVTGLNGTGSKNPVTRQFALNMLERFDLRADPETRAAIRASGLDKTDNLSVVTVTAEVDVMLHKVGNPVDVLISTFDDATSLQGGVLMLTPLYGVDGEVYAIANGPVSVGGFSFSGDAASVQQNHPTTGRVPGGATIEKPLCRPDMQAMSEFRLILQSPNLETASRIVGAINDFWSDHARVFDAGSVDVLVPYTHKNSPQQFMALVQAIRVIPDEEARVVINERTGTVIIGENVRLARVAISHANLSVITGETPVVSQPAPFSDGVTTVVPRTSIDVFEGSSPLNVIDQPVTVGELARSLNELGVTPRDLSSIFQQLKASGALHAKLIFQ